MFLVPSRQLGSGFSLGESEKNVGLYGGLEPAVSITYAVRKVNDCV